MPDPQGPPAPPEVTITGGPGWSVDSRELMGGNGGEEPGPSWIGRGVAVLAAVAVGVATSQALSQERLTGPAGAVGGELALQVAAAGAPGYVTTPDGRLAVAVSVNVRNAGTTGVVLEAASIPTTGLRDDTVRGRELPPGESSPLSLLRPVDCQQLPDGVPATGPLVIAARSGVGEQDLRLRLDDDVASLLAQQERRACGRMPLSEAVQVDVAVLQIDDGVARLPFALRNVSAQQVLVTAVQPVAGLRLELSDDQGAAAAFPIALPGVDFRGPQAPADVEAEDRRLIAVLRLADCAEAAADPVERDRPLLEVAVSGAGDEPSGAVPYGDGDRLLRRLVSLLCPADGT